ncbi:MAG TPA: DinB family protein [Pyrinomonadaceae bacterium]|nr:DinB family protein [Pyrinomonadaceae bacterium]
MHLTLDELIAYTDEERAKWERWFDAHGEAAPLKLLPAGDLHASLGAFVLHVFGPEHHYVQFLRGDFDFVDLSRVRTDDAAALFDFGRRGREQLRAWVHAATPEDWERRVEPREEFPVPARKIIAHVLLHEVRHWAQIAALVRHHGLAPPGDHDLLFSAALK